MISGKKKGLALARLLIFVLLGGPVASGAVLIPAGAIWRYNDTGQDLGTDWVLPDYDDSDWSEGAAELGYGDGDEATVISYGDDGRRKHPTYYFRYVFELRNPSPFTLLRLRVVRDDGCIVYLNGTEVARSNMPDGPVSFDTFALRGVSGTAEDTWHSFAVDGSLLVSGTNVVAVEVHQVSRTSSDISFDLSLDDTDPPPPVPTVKLNAPADGSQIPAGTVSFECEARDILGLQSVTLYLGIAGELVTFSGPDQTDDAQIREDQPDTPNGARTTITVDGQDPHSRVVLKFIDLFDDKGGPIPLGASITEATLSLHVTDGGDDVKVYRLIEDWMEGEVTWTNRTADSPWSATAAGGEASHAPEELLLKAPQAGDYVLDITSFVQAWSNGEPNYGIVLIESGGNGVNISSSESGNPPVLSVRYNGTWEAVETKEVSGKNAVVGFSVDLNQAGDYRWNCVVRNTSDQESRAPADFFFTLAGGGPAGQFVRGDVNQDGKRNIADVLRLLGELFSGLPPSTCPDSADANDDGKINIADALRLLGYLFGGQGELPAPAPDCGGDPTPDNMEKCTFEGCP